MGTPTVVSHVGWLCVMDGVQVRCRMWQTVTVHQEKDTAYALQLYRCKPTGVKTWAIERQYRRFEVGSVARLCVCLCARLYPLCLSMVCVVCMSGVALGAGQEVLVSGHGHVPPAALPTERLHPTRHTSST